MKRFICSFLISLLFTSQVFAGTKVAVVKMIRGEVVAELAGKIIKLKKGDWVEEGQLVKTEKKSFVKLVFIDKSSINIGPGSEVIIENFSKTEAGLLNLVRGKIRAKVTKDYLEMSKGQKSKLYLKSASAVMGIRGTDFMFTYSEKTKTSSAILFEGSVSFSKLKENERPQYKNMEKFIERDNIRIKPGEFSVATKGATSATIPAVLNVKQREALEKNENFGTQMRTPASTVKKDHKQKSLVPPGLSGKIVANNNSELKKEVGTLIHSQAMRAPASVAIEGVKAPTNIAPTNAEGFITSDGAVKPANGSMMHLDTGTIIAPPENSAYDPGTNTYIASDEAGTISSKGEYTPPKNIIYKEETGEFIQIVETNGQLTKHIIVNSDTVMPTEPLAHYGEESYAGDPVVGAVPVVPPSENDLYNDQFNPDGLNDYNNNNIDYGYQPEAGDIIRARVGFDFTIQ
jgi:hypothetical protein